MCITSALSRLHEDVLLITEALCTEKELKEMGIPLGPRMKILHSLRNKCRYQVCKGQTLAAPGEGGDAKQENVVKATDEETCFRRLDVVVGQFDPVAYRIEPLIVSDVEFEPMLLPHHKGRKRMHLGLHNFKISRSVWTTTPMIPSHSDPPITPTSNGLWDTPT
ncbi:phospholipase DDHD2-like [Hemicordylus capensis]|uniref:phospholipase DDHD2-like n=1 Tax=Hemicordylus capensis TaxID=884348 RepID=UPI0023032632|nr:phospholipase DDHD2-like [Hemicordylus capensis]